MPAAWQRPSAGAAEAGAAARAAMPAAAAIEAAMRMRVLLMVFLLVWADDVRRTVADVKGLSSPCRALVEGLP